jgi:hypothetical protein
LGGLPAKYGKKRKNNLLNLSGLKKINKDLVKKEICFRKKTIHMREFKIYFLN